MSLAFTVIKCDGLNGVKDRPCAALLSVPARHALAIYLQASGWLTKAAWGRHRKHMCPGCRSDRKTKPIET